MLREWPQKLKGLARLSRSNEQNAMQTREMIEKLHLQCAHSKVESEGEREINEAILTHESKGVEETPLR
jgi:hypothetical protein